MISVFAVKTEWQYENPAEVKYEEDRACKSSRLNPSELVVALLLIIQVHGRFKGMNVCALVPAETTALREPSTRFVGHLLALAG